MSLFDYLWYSGAKSCILFLFKFIVLAYSTRLYSNVCKCSILIMNYCSIIDCPGSMFRKWWSAPPTLWLKNYLTTSKSTLCAMANTLWNPLQMEVTHTRWVHHHNVLYIERKESIVIIFNMNFNLYSSMTICQTLIQHIVCSSHGVVMYDSVIWQMEWLFVM